MLSGTSSPGKEDLITEMGLTLNTEWTCEGLMITQHGEAAAKRALVTKGKQVKLI